MRVFIGYDEREAKAAEVAAKSLLKVSGLRAEFLCADKLADQGLLNRISDHRGAQDYDLVSNHSKSTRFAVSRFLTPIICPQGFALFVDCDVVFYRDPREMFWETAAEHAVNVVKHDYVTTTQWKMVNQSNANYHRKNWSSVMLFNCDHPANRRLTLWDVNNRPGRDLHRFYWLHDAEIGQLHPTWNWLVGEQPKPETVIGIAHFTLGGPWLPAWHGGPHDDLWKAAEASA